MELDGIVMWRRSSKRNPFSTTSGRNRDFSIDRSRIHYNSNKRKHAQLDGSVITDCRRQTKSKSFKALQTKSKTLLPDTSFKLLSHLRLICKEKVVPSSAVHRNSFLSQVLIEIYSLLSDAMLLAPCFSRS